MSCFYDIKCKNDSEIINRTFDGKGNNLYEPLNGSVGVNMLRLSTIECNTDLSQITPTPREISNKICDNNGIDITNKTNMTNMFWVWGQFLDHEIVLIHTNKNDPSNMQTPPDDAYPGREIPFNRSNFELDNSGKRRQQNSLSSFIDATNVYGYNSDRAFKLRKLDGTGKLKTLNSDNGEIIPIFNTCELENAPNNDSSYFVCGDIRSNENLYLLSLHTLFIREHNRLCDNICQKNPCLKGQDELIYQKARRLIYAEMQQITYNEYLPSLLGKYAPKNNYNYNKNINCGIFNEFSTVGYRVGHAFIPSSLKKNSTDPLTLVDSFFNPLYVKENGIDQLLIGSIKSKCNELSTNITNDLRNCLFGCPTDSPFSPLLDLASLNIQRGRDHGIPDYNSLRESLGLTKYVNFSQITDDVVLQQKLMNTYSDINSIDPWIGALSEKHLPTSQVGELLKAIILEQFINLRDGDRFWWKNDPGLSNCDRNFIANITLSKIIKYNIDPNLRNNVQCNVFKTTTTF